MVGGLSYDTMRYVASLRHPRHVYNNERVKFKCCRAKFGKISLTEKERAITDAEEELGIGMTIYFRQMKFFAMIFMLLTIVSIPTYILFATTGPGEGGSLFFKFSLGNMGMSDVACSSAVIPAGELKAEIPISCKVGTISAMLDFGLSTEMSQCPAPSHDNLY